MASKETARIFKEVLALPYGERVHVLKILLKELHKHNIEIPGASEYETPRRAVVGNRRKK